MRLKTLMILGALALTALTTSSGHAQVLSGANDYTVDFLSPNYGWRRGDANGAFGSVGESVPITAFAITPKGAWPFCAKLSYKAHVINGATLSANAGQVIGQGGNNALDRASFSINNSTCGYETAWLQYYCHVAGIGWTGPHADGVSCGTFGQRLEAVSLKVTRQIYY